MKKKDMIFLCLISLAILNGVLFLIDFKPLNGIAAVSCIAASIFYT